ncbi:MAG TPA: helix-hairpin-helix domain-containing protein [Saprospiraceae bacterium]|nr:helix-hairpin-helix domain-containing protein [Saprospiraceae bacterium]
MSSFLYFNQAERRGVLFFFSLIGLTVLLPLLYRGFWRKPGTIQVDIQSLDTIPEQVAAAYAPVRLVPDSLFPFDPNTADKETLLALGLPARTANTLINYRNKGGRFFRKEELKKIYGVEAAWYEKVVDYIHLPESPKKSPPRYSKEKPAYPAKAPIRIAVNSADAETWAQLRGIGPVLSSRIVKFRDKLGGFYDVEQVKETYGLSDSTFQTFKAQLDLKQEPQKLYINQLSTEELAQHPYISWKLARVMVNYRKVHGPFPDQAAMQKIYILEAETLQRLEPYLDFCTECPTSDGHLADKE